ncbi:MAG TPA: hypothetical protein VK791_00310 [bacterium]|jgi:hypothetical protein|nr:hypothetical protein [bacterium]
MARKPKSSGPSGAFLLRVCLGSLLGSLLLAAIAYGTGYLYFAKGLFLGALLSPLHLLGLKSMVNRVLAAGQAQGPGLFRIYHLIRWVLFAFIIWALLTVSVFCLLGALVSYTWFLLMLVWAGLKTAE